MFAKEDFDTDLFYDHLLKKSEMGEFNSEYVLNYLASNEELFNFFYKSWNLKKDEKDTGGFCYVNNLVAYRQETSDNVSLHIMPAGTLDNQNLVLSILDGFKKISEKLKQGEIVCNKITMKSWLLGKSLENKIKILFSSVHDLNIMPVDPSDADGKGLQFLALLYNGVSLKNFLLKGELPEVRELKLSSKDFVGAFAN